MTIALWIVAVMMAAVYASAGLAKLTRTRDELAEPMPWVEDFGDRTVRAIGTAELLGSVALVVPPLLGVGELLVPVAAAAFAALMLGAVVVNGRRRDLEGVVMACALLAMAVFVAWGRSGSHAF
jgi:hypothetical protein